MQGWIKLHRIIRTKPIWKKSNAKQKVILITILLMANHDSEEWEWMGERFKVNPGQFITSLENLAEECGKDVSVQNVRTCLLKLEKAQFLTNKSTKTGRLVSVVNWEVYQSDEKNQQTDKQTGNKEVTTNKNDKNDKKKDIGDLIFEFTESEQLRSALHDFIRMRMKKKAPVTERAMSNLLSKLKKLSNDTQTQIAILDESINKSWSDVYPLKEFNQGQKENQTQQAKPRYEKFDAENDPNYELFKKNGYAGVQNGKNVAK